MRAEATAGTSGTANDPPPPTRAGRLRRLRRHTRAVDGRGVARIAVGVLFVEPVTRAEETAAWHLAARIHGWWFLGARGAGGPTVTGNGAG